VQGEVLELELESTLRTHFPHDAWNRLSINTPALLNNAGKSIEATVNKAAPGNNASFALKSGFSARALIGLLGSDYFSFKVRLDGSAYHEAILIDRNTGRIELPKFLAPRLFMNNGATAAAVAFDCAGVYLETDY
jgi:hypothetical protein